MCALIPFQRAAAELSAEIVGDSSEIISDIDTDALTFTVRVTSEAGDSGTYTTSIFGEGQDRSYEDPITGLLVNEQTFIGFEEDDFTANPVSLTLNGAGTHDVTFTIPRSKIPDVRDNVEFYFELWDPNVAYDPDDEETWYPFFETDVIWTLYFRNPNDTVLDVGFDTLIDTQELLLDQIRDVTFTLSVESRNDNPVEVTFSVGSILGALISPTEISFSPTSVIVEPNSVENAIVTIPANLFFKKAGWAVFTLRATPTGDVAKSLTLRVKIISRADLFLEVLGSLDTLTRTSTTGGTEDITWTLRVTNGSSSADGINLTIDGDIETATVNPASVVLFPDSYEDITFTVPRTALATAGTYSLTVKATSVNTPTLSRTVTTKIIISESPDAEGDQTKSVGPGTPDPTQPIEPTQPVQVTYKVVFSEIMFASKGGNDSLPQWLEVYNNSTATINLRGWKLQWKQLKPVPLEITATFQQDFIIPSQQCRLIVSALGRHSGRGNLDNDDVYLFATLLASLVVDDEEDPPAAPAAITTAPVETENNYSFITQDGFSLSLLNANDVLVDRVGTLQNDEQAWKLHECIIEGVRSSLIRRFDEGVPRTGTEKRAWRRAYDTKHLVAGIYYGNTTDLGTPGYRSGKPVPVELSYFSARFDNNSVVINWTTESELNSAGFNILRSTSRTKNFKPINAKMIQGAGTTAQRNKYQFIDKTAKPDVAYYYRLEEIDLSGTRAILSTYQLRGVVAPVGKHITTWGDIKNRSQ